MDFRHLEPEDYEFECLLRGVDANSPNAYAHLNSHQNLAAAFDINATKGRRTRGGLNSEISLITDKKEILDRNVQNAIAQSDLSSLETHHSRLLHLLGRLFVVSSSNPDCAAANRLRSETQSIIDKIRAATQLISGPEPEPISLSAIATNDNLLPDDQVNVTSFGANNGDPFIPAADPPNARPMTVNSIPDRSNGPRPYRNGWILANSNRTNTGRPNNRPNQTSRNSEPSGNPGSHPQPNNRNSFPIPNNFNGFPNSNRSSLPFNNHPNNVDHFNFPNNNLPRNNHGSDNVIPIDNVFERTAPVANTSKSPLASWQIKFDGSNSGLQIEEFIFRIEMMSSSEGVSFAQLTAGLHYVLKGSAYEWYWLYMKQNRRATWLDLQTALRNEFRSRDSDYEIRKKADSMHQSAREPFSEFKLRVATELSKLNQPISEPEKLAMLKRNVRPDIRKALFYRNARNINELTNLCRDFEKLQFQLGEDRPNINNCRRLVHEVDISQDQMYFDPLMQQGTPFNCPYPIQLPNYYQSQYLPPIENDSVQVQDIRPNNFSVSQIDNTNRAVYNICWNCQDIGHVFMDCPVPIAPGKIFCFGCGAPNVLKPNCHKCKNNLNRHPNLMAPGSQVSLPKQNPGQFGPNRTANRQLH